MPAAMTDAWIVGASSTRFERAPDKSTRDLAREAYCAALADAGMETGNAIEMGWFSNCGMWVDGQASIRGQVLFTPLVREGLFPERVPMINVEGGCASAQMALHGAWKDILSGQSDVSLAIGVEKLFNPQAPEDTMAVYEAGIDRLTPEEWRRYYAEAGEEAGKPFEDGPDRTVFMDTYAMQACYHMKVHGTTQRQIAASASKNHRNGALNEKAQYSFDLSVEDVLNDRPVSWPLTRAMCSPVGDGAAAVLVCSADFPARPAARGAGPRHPHPRQRARRRQIPPARRARPVAHGGAAGLRQGRRRAAGYRCRRSPRRDLLLRDLPGRDDGLCGDRQRRRAGRERRDGDRGPHPGQHFGRAGLQGPSGRRDRPVDDLRTGPPTARRGRGAPGRGAPGWPCRKTAAASSASTKPPAR